MTTAYIALGKIGDILNILPILADEFFRFKQPQILIIAKQYARIFKGMAFLEVVEYDGHWQDLIGAMRWAKRSFSQRVVVLSIYDKAFAFQHKTPSFLMEPYERVGRLKDFDNLVLPIHRSPEAEEKLIAKYAPAGDFVLYADHGESSPFPHREALAKLIKDVLGENCTLVRLSEIWAEHFFHLLGIYERAKCIIATETAHLHLTRAVQTPVIALTQDNPSRWHGTPHCKRFVLTCRYSEFENRRHEIVDVLQSFGHARLPTSVQVVTQRPYAYNPTIHQDFPGMIYRYHPEKNWKTALVYQGVFDGAKQEWPIQFPPQFDGMSLEDARFFKFQGKPHISMTIARHEFGQTNAVVGYGEFKVTAGGATAENIHIPEYGLNAWGAIEKNWVFFEHDGKLMCIYECNEQQVILEVRGKRVWNVLRSEPHAWQWGKIRGGCIIQWKGRLLRFFHSHTTNGPRDKWVYNIGALTMEDKPPFQMLQISKKPVIAGDEIMNLYCRHWKQNVVFPGGVRVVGNEFHLAYGYNDCECRIAALSETDLNL